MSDLPTTDGQSWGSPSQLAFVRSMAEHTPAEETFPLRREFILWLLDRVESSGEPRDDAPLAPPDPNVDGTAFYNPPTQVYFRAGLIACREYMARFVEAESPSIAASIRANWWPSLGADYGPPRLIKWAELTEGEYGTPTFRALERGEVSATLEALPVALGFMNTHCSSETKDEK